MQSLPRVSDPADMMQDGEGERQMPKARKRVAYARINRRSETTEAFQVRPFSEDMEALAESRETRAEFRGATWIAADLSLDASGDFMSGVLGFSDVNVLVDFEDAAFSWLKGATHEHEGASERTMVPFAVDLREHERWVAFGTSPRIQPQGFAAGFEATLNGALDRLGLTPSEWEVDLVLGKARVEEWLIEHPNVVKFTRIVRFQNPGRSLDDDRAEMRALAARTKSETFTVPVTRPTKAGERKPSHLAVQDNPDFNSKLEGLDTGDLDIHLEAVEGSTRVTFDSRRMADRSLVEDYGSNLERGMEIMLRAVQEYGVARVGGQEHLP